MRLWHKDLISVLPRQQLLGQWRECCAITSRIYLNGSPHHMLVNKIMDYPIEEFVVYTQKVYTKMISKGYKCDWDKFIKYINTKKLDDSKIYDRDDIFTGWHNDRYLKQCYYNLQEKYDCDAITTEDWIKIHEHYMLIQEGLI